MEDKIITIKSFVEHYEANYTKDFLIENGIEASLSDENMVGLLPMFNSPFGGIRLNILEKDKEKAEQLLLKLKIQNA